MSTLDDWVADAAAALKLPGDVIPADLRDGLLDITRDVAHGVTRIAGPLTTYLIGLAVGAGMDRSAALRTVSDVVARATEAATEASGNPAGEHEAAAPGDPASR